MYNTSNVELWIRLHLFYDKGGIWVIWPPLHNWVGRYGLFDITLNDKDLDFNDNAKEQSIIRASNAAWYYLAIKYCNFASLCTYNCT